MPFAPTDTCQTVPLLYDSVNVSIPAAMNDFGVFPRQLLQAGYEVWIAHVATGPLRTPSIFTNANCLKQQLAYIHQTDDNPNGKVILIAHSMGGLVGRGYLESDKYAGDVERLITLGTPHAGTTYATLFCNLLDLAACQFTPAGMLAINVMHQPRIDVPYDLIGGDLNPGLAGLSLLRSDGPNDGVVGASSAVGRLPACPARSARSPTTRSGGTSARSTRRSPRSSSWTQRTGYCPLFRRSCRNMPGRRFTISVCRRGWV